MFSSWHLLGAEVMYWAPKFVQSLWRAKAIYITENGCVAGLVYVDFKTQKRKPKISASFFREVATRNAVA